MHRAALANRPIQIDEGQSMSKHFAHIPATRVAAAVGLALSALAAPAAWSANTDTQVVNFSIANMSEIDVAAGPIALNIVAPAAGSAPVAATAASTYNITTNASAETHSKKITAQINEDMPTNVTLSVTVAAPTASGTSQSAQTLSSTPVDVVTGLQGAAQSNVAINYSLSASVDVPAQSDTRTVTYTVVDL